MDFIDVLPRLPTGKLYKQALRARYLARERTNTVQIIDRSDTALT
ncbi:MAG TPA: hypothetical protein VKI44_04645 [Acetobacteraceae bacterium]|nr:hypothetical protein [Acetobacteraceae bacterium]